MQLLESIVKVTEHQRAKKKATVAAANRLVPRNSAASSPNSSPKKSRHVTRRARAPPIVADCGDSSGSSPPAPDATDAGESDNPNAYAEFTEYERLLFGPKPSSARKNRSVAPRSGHAQKGAAKDNNVVPLNPFMPQPLDRPIDNLNFQHFNRWKNLYPVCFTSRWKALWEPAICPLTAQRLDTKGWSLAEPQRSVFIERDFSMLASYQHLLTEMIYQRLLAGYQIGEVSGHHRITAGVLDKKADAKRPLPASKKGTKSAKLTAYIQRLRAQRKAAAADRGEPNVVANASNASNTFTAPLPSMTRPPTEVAVTKAFTAAFNPGTKSQNTKSQICNYRLQNGENVHELEFDPGTDRVSVKVWSPEPPPSASKKKKTASTPLSTETSAPDSAAPSTSASVPAPSVEVRVCVVCVVCVCVVNTRAQKQN